MTVEGLGSSKNGAFLCAARVIWLDGAKRSAKAGGEAISQLEAWEILLCLYVFLIGHSGNVSLSLSLFSLSLSLCLSQFIMIHQYFRSVQCTGSIPRVGAVIMEHRTLRQQNLIVFDGEALPSEFALGLQKCRKLTNSPSVCSTSPLAG